jgi:thioredoxin
MSEQVISITDANFAAEVGQSSLPVLLDFTAHWCGPCRAVAPIVGGLAVELAGKIKVGKVDADENPNLCTKFNVRSIPTLLMIKPTGEVVGPLIGMRSRDQIWEWVQKAL